MSSKKIDLNVDGLLKPLNEEKETTSKTKQPTYLEKKEKTNKNINIACVISQEGRKVSTFLDVNLQKWLEEFCLKTGRKKMTIFNEALLEYLQKYDKE